MGVPPPGPGEDVFSTVPTMEPIWPPRLVENPGWFGGLEGYGGLLALGAADTREAYAFLGSQVRFRYDYYELGAFLEFSDRQADDYRAFGGFLGAWLPFRGWVDFEAALSVGARTYTSNDSRYGADGYDVSSPTLGLRLGVFDRTSSYSAVAGRIGGQILFNLDLNPSDEPWSHELTRDGVPITESGSTRVGGYTLALALVIGFDIGKPIQAVNAQSARAPRRQTTQ
jgi:hypothetical protein